MGGQGAARLGGGLVGGAAGARVEQGAFLQGADDGAHPFLDGLVPVALGGVGLGGGAVFGGAAGAVVEEGGGGGRGAVRGAQAPPQGGHDRHHGEDDDESPSVPPGVAAEAAPNSLSTQSQKAFRARWTRPGSFSWYIALGQLALGRLPRGIARDGHRWCRRRADSARTRCRAGVRPCEYRRENSPRRVHRISSPVWCRRPVP